MKVAGYFIALALLLISCSSTRYIQSKKQRGEVVFFDDFNLKKLDTSKWSTLPYWGGEFHPGATYQWYSDQNFSFTDSTIILWAKNDTLFRGEMEIPYSIGLLDNSKVMDQKYGYFEIRCRIPEGQGLWPAFWLVSRHAWPPEIDIFEFYTTRKSDAPETNVHWGTSRNKQMKKKKHSVINPSSEFHTYSLEWRPDVLKWYIDGELVRSEKKIVKFLNHPMHITINIAIEDKHREHLNLPQGFEVDYVKVLSFK